MSKKLMRICSWIVAITLVIQMLPVNVLATEDQSSEEIIPAETVAPIGEETEPVVELDETIEDAYVLEEVVENRTEYSKDFRLSNGLHMAAVYSNAVHFQRDGQWEDIDNTLTLAQTRSGNGYTNTAANWQVFFPEKLADGKSVSISKDGFTLRFSIAGELKNPESENDDAQLSSAASSEPGLMSSEKNTWAQQVVSQAEVHPANEATAEVVPTDVNTFKEASQYQEAVIEKLTSRLLYENIYANTDIVYDLDSTKLKESIIMQQYDADLRGYSYILDTGTMNPVLNENNEIVLYGEDSKEPVMRMPAPYLFDEAGSYCYDVVVVLEDSEEGYVLSYILPQEWLSDENRQWPVTLDPIVDTIASNTNAEDQIVYENSQYSSPADANVLNVGYDTTCYTMRTYMRYNTLPSLSSADVIVNASIELYCTVKEGTDTIVEVREVLGDWNAGSITWSTQPTYSSIVKDYVVTRTPQTFYTWDITDIVRTWYAGSNNGMIFKATDTQEAAREHSFLRYYSANFTSTCKPTLTIVYRNNNGLESYWDYTSASAGRAGTGYINNYTGNLVWVHEDIGFGGNRMPVAISHIYNANDRSNNTFGMGYGWRTNYNQRVYQWSSNSQYYIWEDADGTKHYFKYASSGTYKDEDGLELTLTTTGSGASKYKIADKYGNHSYFDEKGRLVKLENNQKTKSDIDITYTTTTGNLISTITDGANRLYTFSYSSSLLSKISYTGTGTTEISYVKFGYTDSKLTSITYKDSEVSKFSYTTNRLLSAAEDITGYKLQYTYNTTASNLPNRVQTVTETDGSASGGVLTISYAKNQTTFTDYSGNVQIMQFNNWGNTISVQDNLGRAQYAKYATDTTETAKGNQLSLSSKLQNTVGNVLDDSSFENGTLWGTIFADRSYPRISSAEAYLGNKSLAMVHTADGQSSGIISPSFTVGAGETFTFSGYVKTGEGNAYLCVTDGSVWLSSETLPAGSDWTRLEVSYTNTGTSAKSVTARIQTTQAGTTYLDCVQVEKAPTASRYNLIQNGDFRTTTFWSSSNGRTTVSTAVAPELSKNVYKLNGSPTARKRIYQTVAVSGSAGDAFVLAGWAKADSASLETPDTNPREFALIATFNNTDGTTSDVKVRFNPYVGSSVNWQYAAAPIVAPKAYSSVKITLAYDYNVNAVYFDGIQLYKEEFGSSYTYDSNGNLTKVTDVQDQTTEYTYNTKHDLTAVKLPTGTSAEYEYDSYHNVTKATTPEGTVYTLTYDAYGNNLTVTATADGKTMTSSATYTSDGNRLASTTDAAGNKTTYTYNSMTNVLTAVQSPKDTSTTKTQYTYNSMYRLATAKATTDTGLALTASYTYTDDLLTKVTTGSTVYTLSYGNFDLRSNIKIGSRTLATYTYTDRTNYLKKLAYGNGDSVQYTYDTQGRVTKETYEDSSTVTYQYDNNGALAAVTDSESGITSKYLYDFAGRAAATEQKKNGTSILRTSLSYDSYGRLKKRNWTVGSTSYYEQFTYDGGDGALATMRTGAAKTLTMGYDGFGRLTSVTGSINARTYAYRAVTTTKTTGQIATLTYPDLETPLTYTYTYDSMGNIQTISDPLQGTRTYTYDSQNQLTQEKIGSTTYSYSYDNAGNLLTATNSTGSHTYTYGDSTWGDLLMKYDGQSITYDTIGNPTSYYNGTRWTFTWKNGRQLATATNGTNSISYTYDANGLRHSKTVDGVVYTYYYEGGRLMRMTVGTSITMDFFYDQNGQPFAMKYNGTILYYVLNAQGDVVRIVNASGGSYGIYKYDAWGNILYITDNQYLNNNPLRYRGYVYDSDSALYYCQSRYYDPATGRFLNSDISVSTGQGFTGNNMFAYCGNNPVARIDESGTAFETAWDIFSLGSSIWNVAMNPSDPWAWIGLAGDVVDVALPFVGGVGEATRILRASNAVDDMCDAYNAVENSSDTITTLYRSVSNAEAEDILATGRFNLPSGGMESKQFGFDLDETRQFGKWAGQDKIVSARIPANMLNQFYTGGVDTSIFRAGTLTVYGDQLDVFNQAVRGTIKFIP